MKGKKKQTHTPLPPNKRTFIFVLQLQHTLVYTFTASIFSCWVYRYNFFFFNILLSFHFLFSVVLRKQMKLIFTHIEPIIILHMCSISRLLAMYFFFLSLYSTTNKSAFIQLLFDFQFFFYFSLFLSFLMIFSALFSSALFHIPLFYFIFRSFSFENVL